MKKSERDRYWTELIQSLGLDMEFDVLIEINSI